MRGDTGISGKAWTPPAGDRQEQNRRFGAGSWALFAASILLCLGAATAIARKKPAPTKTVNGQVFDPSNKPVVGADVELTDLTTKKKLDMYTQQNGAYQFGGLSFDHSYRVKASYNGLTSESRVVSSWDPRAEMVLNLYLHPLKK